jgi:hypothetical protein
MLQCRLRFASTMDSYNVVRIDALPRVTWTRWWRGVPVWRRRGGLERYGEVYASSLLPAIKPAELGHDMIPCGPHCHIDINVRCSLHGITLFFFRFLSFFSSFVCFFLHTHSFCFPHSISLSNHIPRYVFPVNLTSNRIESPSALNSDFSPSHRVI